MMKKEWEKTPKRKVRKIEAKKKKEKETDMAQQSSSQESCSDTITRNKPDTIKHEENSIEGGMKKLKVEDEMKGKIDFYY
jgi:hypothetical protein